jgi:glucuronate isomerase
MSDIFSNDFLLGSGLAKDIYARAASLPIIDYHSHLPVDVLASNRPFANLTDIWIRGDHYKWRAMRLNGMSESLCSGTASDEEKYKAWAATAPITLRNPLYHWNCLELQRYFGIDRELSPATAPGIWEETNALLQTDAYRPQALLDRMGVEVLCTTDDPADDLRHHRTLRHENGFKTRVYPTFRPDGACVLQGVVRFREWIDRLSSASNLEIKDLTSFLYALRNRHDEFHQLGCRVSDHGLEHVDVKECTESMAMQIFSRLLRGVQIGDKELEQWRSFMMRLFGEWNHERGWVMMLHLGALRNNNSRVFSHVGLDTGCDSIGDFSHAREINHFLNSLDVAGKLPKVVLFNSNPRDNLLFATIAANFFEEGMPGKVQYGPSWWFLDTAAGIKEQFDALSLVGLAHRFIGMVTDSRSFLSFSRHEYFRRLLCNLYAEEALAGLLPNDSERLLASLEGIFYHNARNYFNWENKSC